MNDDSQLLRRYIEDRSENAFTELVQRHVQLVYFAALRRVGGDAHLADDVTQRVFTDLSCKAASLKDRPTLTGWLYTSTRFAAAQSVRTERRRKTHEQDAHVMQELHPNQDSPPDWDRLRPMIDEALDELNEHDREAVLLRYFENRPFAEVAAKFSLTPDAARMRVDRALEKLRAALGRRGIISTAAALGSAFATQAAMAAPAGLTQKVVGLVLSQTVPAATVTTAALWKIVASIAVSVGMGAAYLSVQHLRKQATSEQSPATTSTESAPATTPAAASLNRMASSENSSPAANSTAPVTSSRTVHRTTDDFGWPRIGLFAGDDMEKHKHTTAEFHAMMKNDPDFRDVVVAQAKDNLDQFYGHLFRNLQLPPARLDAFKNLLVEKERLRIDVVESQPTETPSVPSQHGVIKTEVEQSQKSLDAEIKTTLGDSGFVAYLQYREDLTQWTVIEAVARKLKGTATPLTDNQTNQLLVLLRSALLRIRPPYTFDIVYGAGVFCPHIGAGITPRVLRQASAFLFPLQVDALRQLQKPRLVQSTP